MTKKRNLTQEKILQATVELAKEIGLAQINFPNLAAKLDIKYPSLYNHFKNMKELKLILTGRLLEELTQTLADNLVGLSRSEAVRAYCQVYLNFAFENEAVYELLINIPHTHSEILFEKSQQLNLIIQKILRAYQLSGDQVIHKSRELRSLLHGYISLSFLGYFQQIDVDAEISYREMVEDFVFLLENPRPI
ncbi:TetR/AcrR family transcriptional regulator [Enterococcus timonensis]|uniref:TetR/AcrR family transcriptional regulator n=1 Tax=Enterococcus timonensis TaxID=1852364 RepID=UPI0008DA1B49|nr:TetR/AcrR family transcriptional regulator [Enterococcus timonensis]